MGTGEPDRGGVVHFASGQVREVWLLASNESLGTLDAPLPGRPLFRELLRRGLSSLLKRTGPQETLYRDDRRVGHRDAHGDAWEPAWRSEDEDLTRSVENHPLALAEFLRAPSGSLNAIVESEETSARQLYELEFDLHAMEDHLSPLALRTLRGGGDATAAIELTVDSSGFPNRIARRDGTHEGREMWTVLEFERCEEAFESVDLFARWDAG